MCACVCCHIRHDCDHLLSVKNMYFRFICCLIESLFSDDVAVACSRRAGVETMVVFYPCNITCLRHGVSYIRRASVII